MQGEHGSLVEIAEWLGVSKLTARSWSFNGKLPEPEDVVGGRIPVWHKPTILAWAEARANEADARHTEAKVRKDTKPAPKPVEDGELSKGDKVYVDPSVTGFARKRTHSFTVLEAKARGRGLQVTIIDENGKTRVVRGSEVSTEPFPTKGAKAA